MPPKKKFSKEQIIDVAFNIACEEGINGITIRKVADKLGSSIAPIYVNFNEVDELKSSVINKVFRITEQMLQEQNTGNPFYDIGLASLRFAREYDVLYLDLVMNHHHLLDDYDQETGHSLIEHMKQDPNLKDFTQDELKSILLKMRIFQMGLSMMVARKMLPKEFDKEEKLIEMLKSTGIDVIAGAHLRKNGKLP